LTVGSVYDHGSIYSHKVLDLTDDDLLLKFQRGVRNIASLSLAIGIPTIASLPHSITRGYKNILSISLATEYTFEKAQKIKDYLANPGAFVATAPVVSGDTHPKGGAPAKEVKEEKKKEEEKVSDEDMGFGLFD